MWSRLTSSTPDHFSRDPSCGDGSSSHRRNGETNGTNGEETDWRVAIEDGAIDLSITSDDVFTHIRFLNVDLLFRIIFRNQILQENVASLFRALFKGILYYKFSLSSIVHDETFTKPLSDPCNLDLSRLAN